MNERDFMKAFLDLPEPEPDPEYDAAIERYRKTFGQIPPTAMIPDGFTKEQIADAILLCVVNHDADLLNILDIQIDERFVY